MRAEHDRWPPSLALVLASALTLLLALASLTGCPGELAEPARFLENDCGDVPAKLLAPRCGSSGCHGPIEPAGGLDLVSPELARRLVDQPAVGPSCSDQGETLAVPASPGDSLLVRKLAASPPCGSPMPLGQAAFDADEVSCVRRWIGSLDDDAP
jgi:hypothetical protein